MTGTGQSPLDSMIVVCRSDGCYPTDDHRYATDIDSEYTPASRGTETDGYLEQAKKDRSDAKTDEYPILRLLP